MAFVENQGVTIYWDQPEATHYATFDFLAAPSAGIAAGKDRERGERQPLSDSCSQNFREQEKASC